MRSLNNFKSIKVSDLFIHFFIIRCLILFALLFARIPNVIAQLSEAYFKNDSVKYQLIHVTPSVLDEKRMVGGYYVNMEMGKNTEDELRKKQYTFWLPKLQDPSTDFAAHVLLSFLYNREASLILIIRKNWAPWSPIVRENVILEWKEFFEKQAR